MKSVRQSFPLATLVTLIVSVLLNSTTMTKAQSSKPQRKPSLAAASDVDATAAMTSTKFDAWITEQNDKLVVRDPKVNGLKSNNPSILEIALKKRLESGKYVSENAVKTVVDASEDYETTDSGEPKKQIDSSFFAHTKRLIDDLLILASDRNDLKAQLHLRKARLFISYDDNDNAAKEYNKALYLLNALHISVDQQRLESIVELADAFYATGKNIKAEPLYLEALSYPWWNIEGNEPALQAMRELYIRAGKNLINIRSSNLEALKDIFFVPATQDELGPYLQSKIEEAEKQKK